MRWSAAMVAVALMAPACRHRPTPARAVPAHPTGSGVWFADGFGSARDQSQAMAALTQGGFSWVLVPGARLEKHRARWVVVALSPPPGPIAGPPVSPVIAAGPDAAAALRSREVRDRRALEDALVLAVKTIMVGEGRFGRIAGFHFDLPLSAETAGAAAEVLARMRPRVPEGLFFSLTLRFTPAAPDREKLQPLAAAADGLVAMVFGEDENADPAETDRLGRPWWAGYDPNAVGRWKSRNDIDRGSLSEGFLARLSDDPRLLFQQDMEVEERAGFGYLFHVRRPFAAQGHSFAAGDEVAFRQPSLGDLVRRLGADVAGRRNVRGRVVRLAGKSESERIFTLAAFDEILLGRSLSPAIRVSLHRSAGSVRVGAENDSPMPSALSRVTNWIEVDLTRPGIRDVRPGGFDRYEVYSPAGRPVSLGRSSRIRFYETLLSPFEKIEPAVVMVRPPVPPGCCRFRIHVLSAAETESATEWQRVNGSR